MTKLRIQYQGVTPNQRRGPSVFANRLRQGFEKEGHEVTYFDTSRFDVSLAFIKTWFPMIKGKTYIQRLDGIYINSKPNFEGVTFETGNKLIRETYEKVNGHIFQSFFNRDLVQHHFGTLDIPNIVIPNGAPIRETSKDKMDALKKYDFVFASISNWTDRPNKRLKDNLLTFKELQGLLPDKKLCMLAIGPGSEQYKNLGVPNIVFFDQETNEETLELVYKSTDMFFHLSYIDHCPNVVVEALAHGIPILCTNSGGTHELLNSCPNSGVVIDEDWTVDVQDISTPPELDHAYIAYEVFSYMEATDLRRLADTSALSIEKVTNQYLSFIEEIL